MRKLMHARTRPLIVMAAVLALASASIASVAGAAETDLRGGIYADEGGVALGGGVIQRLGAATPWYFNPNVEAAFADHGNLVSMNADLHYDFTSETPYSVYAGAGPALILSHPSRGDTQTDAGLNLVGGVVWPQRPVRPFVQMKGVVSDEGQLAIMGGVRF
jgi:hypothetical protein